MLTSYASRTSSAFGVGEGGGTGPDTESTGSTDTDKAGKVGDETGADESKGETAVDGAGTTGGLHLEMGVGGHFA